MECAPWAQQVPMLDSSRHFVVGRRTDLSVGWRRFGVVKADDCFGQLKREAVNSQGLFLVA